VREASAYGGYASSRWGPPLPMAWRCLSPVVTSEPPRSKTAGQRMALPRCRKAPKILRCCLFVPASRGCSYETHSPYLSRHRFLVLPFFSGALPWDPGALSWRQTAKLASRENARAICSLQGGELKKEGGAYLGNTRFPRRPCARVKRSGRGTWCLMLRSFCAENKH
jgi:hypothetical protein